MPCKKLFQRLALGSAIGVSVMTLNGCGQNQITTADIDRSNTGYTLEVSDPLLSRDVHLEAVNTFPRDGQLVGQATVRNRGGSTRRFAYRFLWRTGEGRFVDQSATFWRQAQIAPGEIQVLTGVGSAPGVRDFVLSIKPAERSERP